jgi:23S rRNA pseudouridine1911/1915/1917 synthase
MDKNNGKIHFDKESPERLDLFLMDEFVDQSRSHLRKLIKGGFVAVNGKVVEKRILLKKGDEVEVTFPKSICVRGVPKDVPFDVVDIQKDFLIVNKPPGLIVCSSERADAETLVNGLLYRFKEFSEFDDLERPGIVHRIDKNTSGLLIVARNPVAQRELSDLFKNRKVKKEYLAVVKGHPDRQGEIDLPIGRHPTERTKMSHVSYSGKEALTRYKVLQYYDRQQNVPDCSLVQVEIFTGRTHQIRVHFAAIGHGILGDEVYGFQSKLMKRQALHSWRLKFEFRGRSFSYFVPVPVDFGKFVFTLKKSMLTA